MFLGMLLTDGLFITPALLLMMFISSMAFSLLGVAAGLVANSTPTLMMFNSILILPMSFMCGTLFDVDALTSFVAGIVWALPLSHTTSLLRAAANDPGFGWISGEWVSLLVMVIYAAAFYAICHYVIRKKLYRLVFFM